MLDAGAREVHMRIACPEINTATSTVSTRQHQDELLAATKSVAEMRDYIGATSLTFLSVEGLYRAMGCEGRNELAPQYTDHCFTGDYPTPITDLQDGVMGGQKQLPLLAEAR